MADFSRLKEMTDEDLGGFDVADVKCRSCSGYGNCGLKTYGIYKGKPISVCNSRVAQLKEKQAAEAAESAEE